MADESPAAARLRGELLRARDLAGLSGRDMARALGISQGTLWRIDTGRQLPSLPRVKAWLDACNVRADRQQGTLELAERVHAETRPWRELLGVDGPGHLQDVGAEQDARLVQNFQPTIVPGLLQTPDYARRAFELGHTRDIDAAVVERLRRQEAMRDSDTRHEFIVGERALRASLGAPPPVMAEQLDRLERAVKDGAAVALLPDAAPVRPWNNFILWTPRDEESARYVTAELVHGAQRFETDDDVDEVERFWARAWELSARGDDAAALIRSAAR